MSITFIFLWILFSILAKKSTEFNWLLDKRKYIFRTIFLVLSLFIILAIIDGELRNRLISIPNLKYSSTDHRMEIWDIAVKQTVKHPIVGLGPDNFRWLYGIEYLIKSPHLRESRELLSIGVPSLNTDNLYLDYFVNSGIIGGVLFLIFVFNIFKLIIRTLKNNSSSLSGGFQLVIIGPLIIYFAHGLLDYFGTMYPFIFFFWLLLGLLVSIEQSRLLDS